MSDKDIYVINEYLPLLLTGTVSNEGERQSRKLTLLTLGDGTLKNWGIVVGIDSTGRERPVFMEATREMGISLHGQDPSGDIVGLRTDEQRLTRNRPYEPYRTQATVNLGNVAWTTVFTCPADSVAKVWIEFGLQNGGTYADYTATLRVKGNVVATGMPVYVDAPSPAFGPYQLAAGEIISAYRDASAGGATAAIYCHYDLYSTGDTNTGV